MPPNTDPSAAAADAAVTKRENAEREARLKAQADAKAKAEDDAAAEAERQANERAAAEHKSAVTQRVEKLRSEMKRLENRFTEVEERLAQRRAQHADAILNKPLSAWLLWGPEIVILERAQAWDLPIAIEDREKELAEAEKELAKL